jgi:hypothetical protein
VRIGSVYAAHKPSLEVFLASRCHHLLKTFFIGPTGWADRPEPDRTVAWTSPTGHTYVTKPGGSPLFPALAVPTGALVLPKSMPPAGENRGLMMRARRQTRAQERAARISWERGINEARITAEAARRAERLAACPFSARQESPKKSPRHRLDA